MFALLSGLTCNSKALFLKEIIDSNYIATHYRTKYNN